MPCHLATPHVLYTNRAFFNNLAGSSKAELATHNGSVGGSIPPRPSYKNWGSNSVGRVVVCQAIGRGFKSHLPRVICRLANSGHLANSFLNTKNNK